MTVIVDANFSLAQVLPLPYSPALIQCMHIWQEELPRIRVPGLWEYEVVIALRRTCSPKLLSLVEQMQTILDELLGMDLEVKVKDRVRRERSNATNSFIRIVKMRSIPSPLAVARRLPSGLKSTSILILLYRENSSCPFWTSQTLAKPSKLTDARRVPS